MHLSSAQVLSLGLARPLVPAQPVPLTSACSVLQLFGDVFAETVRGRGVHDMQGFSGLINGLGK